MKFFFFLLFFFSFCCCCRRVLFCFFFFVEGSQTGTILPWICCIWDSIPWTLVRILLWCAAEEMPMRAMSLEKRRRDNNNKHVSPPNHMRNFTASRWKLILTA